MQYKYFSNSHYSFAFCYICFYKVLERTIVNGAYLNQSRPEKYCEAY